MPMIFLGPTEHLDQPETLLGRIDRMLGHARSFHERQKSPQQLCVDFVGRPGRPAAAPLGGPSPSRGRP